MFRDTPHYEQSINEQPFVAVHNPFVGIYCLVYRSRVAQWKRAGPITQRSVDRNHALQIFLPAFRYTGMQNKFTLLIHCNLEYCHFQDFHNFQGFTIQ